MAILIRKIPIKLQSDFNDKKNSKKFVYFIRTQFEFQNNVIFLNCFICIRLLVKMDPGRAMDVEQFLMDMIASGSDTAAHDEEAGDASNTDMYLNMSADGQSEDTRTVHQDCTGLEKFSPQPENYLLLTGKQYNKAVDPNG